MVQREAMAVFAVKAAQPALSEHGRAMAFWHARPGLFLRVRAKLFVVTTEDVWRLHGAKLRVQFAENALRVLFFPGGESNKRMAVVETLAGGIVTDVSGFLAAVFMRGIPVLQILTTPAPTTTKSVVRAGVRYL